VVVPALAVLIAAGDHVPVMLFVEVDGNVAGVAPTQYGPAASNDGVISVETTILVVYIPAHCPASGVKVYVVVPWLAVLITAGLHDPVMPFSDVTGNAAGVDPTQ
jgi:hypothetical protein